MNASRKAAAFVFGSDVDQSVKDALSHDPGFTHPDFATTPAWVIRDGAPRKARIVGVVRGRGGFDYAPTAFTIIAERESSVIRVRYSDVFWSKDDAALAQAELDTALDL